MIGLEKRVLLRHYLEQGLSRRTVIRPVKRGDLDRDLGHPPRYGLRPPRPSKLDPYEEIIALRLEDYPELSAVRLLKVVQAAGYTGGYSQLRTHVRTVRPRPAPEPPNRFDTPPGRQGQVYFAEFRFPWGKRSPSPSPAMPHHPLSPPHRPLALAPAPRPYYVFSQHQPGDFP